MTPLAKRVGDLTVAVERPDIASRRPPVLLIHGMFGGAWYWAGWQSLLASRGYESHALNLRGHHDSRPVPDLGKVPISAYVDDALEVARTLRNPIVIGHSMGGLIAQKVAEAGVCSACVLMSSAPPRWIPVISWVLLTRQLKYARALTLFETLLPDRSDADALMFNRTPVAMRNADFPKFVKESGRAGFDLSFGVVGVNAARVTAPVYVVTGSDDRFVVPRVARAIAAKYRAPIREYPSFAHHIMNEPGWEKPANDIIDWMDQR